MFKNREEAGLLLGELLAQRLADKENTVLLAIPRGGVPVAYYVAKKTGIPFSMVVAKKITLPDQPETAIGAAAPDGSYILAEGIPADNPVIREAIMKAIREAREKLEKYLGGKEPDISGKNVVIIDDGLATGFTALVSGLYAKNRGANKVILAVPVCPADSIPRVSRYFDDVICYHKVSTPFFAVGAFYQDFHQVSDEELEFYLKKAMEEGLLYL
ncbi:MAG: phosphoribosyltransferase [Aquificae bacterium]|nr:phosphoribosyltransferase [Aquificota bacterium]